MLPLSSLPSDRLSSITMVASDVDDTITTSGSLHPCALEALYAMHEAGLTLVLVTGGSAGWGDVYMRQWPVDMVIAESGALALQRDGDGRVIYRVNDAIDDDVLSRRRALLDGMDSAILSSDQYARLYDIAVDKSRCSTEELEAARSMAVAAGAHWAESSIHLNIWFGEYSKLEGIRHFTGMGDDELCSRMAYIGDSLPDQELFAFFPLSFGVGSVRRDQERFSHLPSFVSEESGGEGFRQIADAILGRR